MTTPSQSCSLLPYCTNEQSEIWERDLWNQQLIHRVTDVLAQRTNQVFPIPEPVVFALDLCKIQEAQERLNRCGCDHNTYLPNRPDDHVDVQSVYNTHYRASYPKNNMTNIRNVPVENDLRFGLDVPWVQDLISSKEWDKLRRQSFDAVDQIYPDEPLRQIDFCDYPNSGRMVFNNVSKAFYNTPDDRNGLTLPLINTVVHKSWMPSSSVSPEYQTSTPL
jgi:hypothetical protein